MLQLTINGTSWMAFRDAMAERTPFKTYGNLEGRTSNYGYGLLPDAWVTEYCGRRSHIDYVVMSYATPIAWHDDERGWVMPPVRYSVTTSKAQSRIAPAVAALNEDDFWVETDGSERDGPDEHDACAIHEEPCRLCGCPIPGSEYEATQAGKQLSEQDEIIEPEVTA